jgi:hypothetical protein
MAINSVSNLNLFIVIDESKDKTYYGCSQEWYATEWQRLSGCGPTAASNIISYLNRTCSALELEQSPDNKINRISLMEEIWAYVTPTENGINSTKMFYEAVIMYTKSKGFNFVFDFCDLPEDEVLRPEFAVILRFIERAMTNDAPVAFLNLCNGKEKNLEQWHWVTIISLECNEDGSNAFINILDQGKIKTIDLALWYNTTTLGGGFVYFTAVHVL